ncbi:MAG: hypothetical protein QM820_37990 [Minicystis sp.]
MPAVEAVIDAVLHQPGEAEIEDVHRRLGAVGRDVEQDVGGLEVAVDHAAPVRVRERAEDLIDAGPHDRPGEQAVGVREVDPLVQRAPRDGVHRQVRRTVLERAEVAGAHDRGVREAREGARLFLKPPRVLGAHLHPRAHQELERDALVRDQVATEVDDPHTAAADLAPHLIAAREDLARLVGARRGSSAVRVVAHARRDDNAFPEDGRGSFANVLRPADPDVRASSTRAKMRRPEREKPAPGDPLPHGTAFCYPAPP